MGPTIMTMISAREAEREALAARIAARAKPIKADVTTQPAHLRRFEEKIGRLREALSDEAVRREAVATSRGLVDSLTINADPTDGTASADLAASTGKLLRHAQKQKTPAALPAGVVL